MTKRLSLFSKSACLAILLAALPTTPGAAQMTGQILNCDSPNPAQPQLCVDNWALDVLDESKTALQQATGPLPRDRKHYFERTGTGVHIFVMDTGIAPRNPDFMTLGNAALSRVGESLGTADTDSASHGTRVTGLAAGLQFGVAKNATIHSVFKGAATQPDQLLDALNWIYDRVVDGNMRPAVLNMSFNVPVPVVDPRPEHLGGIPDLENKLTQRLRDLIAARVVVVVSAGNKNGSPNDFWPSNVAEAIVVGGVDERGDRWVRDSSDPEYVSLCVNLQDCGSNYGAAVDLWAPAKNIRSAVKISTERFPRIRSGTSYAAPLVTGLVALYLQQFPSHTPVQVLTGLRTNAANLGDIDGNGSADYLVRSPVATPACNVPQQLFVNTDKSVQFLSTELADSCPAGYGAYSQFNPTNGQISIDGAGPTAILYRYTPFAPFTGNDQFNYTIYTSTGATFGTGTAKVMVQPTWN